MQWALDPRFRGGERSFSAPQCSCYASTRCGHTAGETVHALHIRSFPRKRESRATHAAVQFVLDPRLRGGERGFSARRCNGPWTRAFAAASGIFLPRNAVVMPALV